MFFLHFAAPGGLRKAPKLVDVAMADPFGQYFVSILKHRISKKRETNNFEAKKIKILILVHWKVSILSLCRI